MICYALDMGKQHLGPHKVVGYGIKIFLPGLFITSPDHVVCVVFLGKTGKTQTLTLPHKWILTSKCNC